MIYDRERIPLIHKTVSDLLKENALRHSQGTAFFFDEESYSWEEVEKLTDRIGLSMLHRGIKKGMHVGFWSMNHIHLLLYMLAAMKIGAVAIAINYSYRAFELSGVLRYAHIGPVFLGEYKRGADYKAMVEEVRGDCPKLGEVFHMAEDLEQIRRSFPLENTLPKEEQERLARAKEEVRPEDVACIAFTSGTTRVPKAVMLTFDNLVNNARQFTARMQVSQERGDVLLAPLPLFHSSGITGMLFHALVTGVPAIVHRRFQAQEVLEEIERRRVTVVMAVPSMLELLADFPGLDQYDLSSLRVGQTSGASITPQRLLQVLRKLGFPHFLTGYGQTECSPLITTSLYEESLEEAVRSAGVPLCHEELRIWVLAEDREAGVGETGEIQVRGFNVMRGYYDSPEENQRKFTRDGWLKTTDAGYLDGQSRLHFVTRLSDLIIRHGENISPAEVEQVIKQYSPGICGVKVVGVRAEIVQEEVACVLACPGERIDPQALQCFVKQRLASYKVPRYVIQVDDLPVTATGKIDQGAVKRIAEKFAADEQQKEEESL